VGDADLLKSPNVRGRGISTVRRESGDAWPEIGGNDVIVKVQRGYDCRPLWNWGRRTPVALRERRALLGCRAAGVHVPLVLDYRQTEGGVELTTTVVPDALTLDVALERHPDRRSRILANAGREIGKLHRARWTHGALYCDHILVCPHRDFRAYLIDLEKGRRSLRADRDLARFERYNSYLTEADLSDFRRGYEIGLQASASAP
jgi:tRNA A-37 threonylcarbamoyl transferase component Bud32